MCYSVHPRNQIFVKSYEFLSFAKNVDKNICKNIGKYMVNIVPNFLITLNNLLQMRLRLL